MGAEPGLRAAWVTETMVGVGRALPAFLCSGRGSLGEKNSSNPPVMHRFWEPCASGRGAAWHRAPEILPKTLGLYERNPSLL